MNFRRCLGLVMVPAVLVLGAWPARAAGEAVDAAPPAKAAMAQHMQGASVFVENDGQWADPEIRFALDGFGANAGLTANGPKFQLFRKTAALNDAPARAELHAFGLVFDGAAAVVPVGRERSESTFNYAVGAPENRRGKVPSFNAVWYENVYPGVSLEMRGRRSGVKYNFHVAPGADWKSIRLRFENIQGLALRPDGALDIRVKDGWSALSDAAPSIYQEVGGIRKAVSGAFRLLDDHSYGFELTGTYDGALPLVIDPEVDWSTCLGGTGSDEGRAIAVDSGGNVYVTGVTASSGWVSAADFHGGLYDACVAKFNAAGAHVWSTCLGAKGDDEGQGIAVDGNGNVYVTGFTDSANWVSGGWDIGQNGGQDGFVVKLDATGAHLWSTFLGGTGTDRAYGIAVDSVGNAFVTGTTDSPDWVRGGWDTTPGGSLDGFVVRLTAAGGMDWASYMGGTGAEYGYAIAVDSNGSNAYVAGSTYSAGWTSGGWDTSQNGAVDGFALKVSKAGDHVWSTYLGGLGSDQAYGIAVDGLGNSYVTGYTTAGGWVSGGFDTVQNGGWDGFVVQLSPAGAHLWSTYLGGTDTDLGQGIAVDGNGVYVTGGSLSAGWVSGGWSTTQNGGYDAFAVKLSLAGGLQWSSYLGGTTDDLGYGIAADANGSVYVTGKTTSGGWVAGGWDTSFGGGTYDAFAAKISQAPTGAVKINNDAVSTNSPNVTLSLTWVDRSTAVVTQMRFSDDGAIWSAWEPINATRAYSLPAGDGQKTVRVQCRDAVGYVSDQFSDAILLDTAPPTGTIVINGNRTATNITNVTLALTWTDGAGSGVSRMRFSNDGSTWSAWESLKSAPAYTIPGTTGDGYKTIRIQFLDLAGNRSAIFNDYIRLDTVGPTGSIVINHGAATTTSRSVSLGLGWADVGSGVTRMRFSDNGSVWTAWETQKATRAYTLPAGLGNHTVRVQFLDAAENYSLVYNDYIKLIAP